MHQIGLVIKKMRKEQGMSQENLAELLGISAVAVSKWENGITMPDISQVVPLTTVFGIRADELFGLSDCDESEQTDEILKGLYQLEDVYPPEQGIKIADAYRDALADHPKNVSILSEALAFCTALICYYHTLTEEEEERLIEDCIHWAERIFKYSDSPDQVTHTKELLIQLYAKLGRFEEAKNLTKTLPSGIAVRDRTMASLLWQSGEREAEKELHIRNIGELLSALDEEVVMLANRYKDEEAWEDALFCYSFSSKMLDSLYGKEHYRPPFLKRGLSQFCFPAECLLHLGKTEEAMDTVERYAQSYLAEREGFNRKVTFENPMLRGKEYRYGFDGQAKFEEYWRRDLAYVPLKPLTECERFRNMIALLAEREVTDEN